MMESPHSHSVKAHILIVDDVAMNRNVLHDFVLALGHIPVLAEDGSRALNLVKTHSFDLILLDIMMPGVSGIDVLAQLKENPETAHIPVVVISALDELQTAANCIELGADDYLTKPFNPVLLKSRIFSSLTKKNAYETQKHLYAELQDGFHKLQETELARDALANMIVHDLNNPLTIISASSSMALSMLESPEADIGFIKESLLNISDASAQMMGLTRSILDVARLENGELKTEPDCVNLTVMVQEICESFQHQASLNEATLHCEENQPDAIYALCDESLTRRILQNLVSNAIGHSTGQLIVELRTWSDADEAIVSIKDNGPGISTDDQQHIFNKYFQAKARAKGRKYGMGVGLPFCKMAIAAQNGRIWVESDEGDGATFHVAFPLYEEDELVE